MKFKIEVNGTLFEVNILSSKGAKLTYEELIKKIISDESIKITAENVA